MAVVDDSADDVRIVECFLADDEEGGGCLSGREFVKDAAGIDPVRAVVEGERHHSGLAGAVAQNGERFSRTRVVLGDDEAG